MSVFDELLPIDLVRDVDVQHSVVGDCEGRADPQTLNPIVEVEDEQGG
jgi:hypothetical protein